MVWLIDSTSLNKLERGEKMKSMDVNLYKPSYWQVIFLQSKVNGATYKGEGLPLRGWDWPKNTYLQRRLRRDLLADEIRA
jgi:hypothetical protein